MAKKPALGKGLGALLGENQYSTKNLKQNHEMPIQGMDFLEISLENIEPNPFQPRKIFDEDEIFNLSRSISEIGVIQPITVSRIKENKEKFLLISGERRLRASKLAKKETLPAYIRDTEDDELLQLAIVENVQRANLNPLEIALGYQRLIDECGITQEELATKVSQRRSTVTNFLRLLKLPPVIQQGLQEKQISMGHARALVNVEEESDKLRIFNKAVEGKLSVRKVEELVRELSKEVTLSDVEVSNSSPKKHVELSALLDSDVQYTRANSGGGRIVIKYSSQKDLERIINTVKK